MLRLPGIFKNWSAVGLGHQQPNDLTRSPDWESLMLTMGREITDLEGSHATSQYPPFLDRQSWTTPLTCLPRIMPLMEHNLEFGSTTSSLLVQLYYLAILGFQSHLLLLTTMPDGSSVRAGILIARFLLYSEVPSDRTENLWTRGEQFGYQRTVLTIG